MTKNTCPTEYQECCVFADWLRLKNIPFTHIVNESGAKGSPAYGAKLKRMGRSKGFPDYLIFIQAGKCTYPEIEKCSDCPRWEEDGDCVYNPRTLAVEMKRQKGGKVSLEQSKWLITLENSGIENCVAYGADEAIKFVERFL